MVNTKYIPYAAFNNSQAQAFGFSYNQFSYTDQRESKSNFDYYAYMKEDNHHRHEYLEKAFGKNKPKNNPFILSNWENHSHGRPFGNNQNQVSPVPEPATWPRGHVAALATGAMISWITMQRRSLPAAAFGRPWRRSKHPGTDDFKCFKTA